VTRIDASEGTLSLWLAAADLIHTWVANAGAEAVHLNRVAPMPCNRSLFLLTDPAFQGYQTLHSGLHQTPMASQGLARRVPHAEELPTALAAALDLDSLLAFWSGRLRTLVPGHEAALKIAHRFTDLTHQASL
jgi:hypothetical protein